MAIKQYLKDGISYHFNSLEMAKADTSELVEIVRGLLDK